MTEQGTWIMRPLAFSLLTVVAALVGGFRSPLAIAQCCDGGGNAVFGALAGDTTVGPVSLFDGLTLNGWGDRDGKTNENWDIDDGAIHRKSGGKDLYLQQTTGDFELFFEWKIAAGGNSGVKYRVARYGDQWLGCEYQLLDDREANEKNKTASLYDVVQPAPGKPLIRAGEWNLSRIVVRNNRIEHWLNGVLVVRIHTNSREWDQAVAGGKFAAVPGFGENRCGRIFLQNHGSEVWFRNLYLTTFAEPCPENVPACQFPTGNRWRATAPVCFPRIRYGR